MLNVFIQIITILTFVILCMSVLPPWIRRWRKKVEIRVVPTPSEYKIMINYFEPFVIKKIHSHIHPSLSQSFFDKYNYLFQLRTCDEITREHFIVVKKGNIKEKINQNSIVVPPDGILIFEIEISSGNTKNRIGCFKLQMNN